MSGSSRTTAGSVEIDIRKILDSRYMAPKAMSRTVILHTTKLDLPIVKLYSVEYSRDYANNVADYTLVTFDISAGVWVRDIAPYIDNLEISIITKYYGETDLERYKFIPMKYPTNNAGSMFSAMDATSLDKTAMLNIEGQCLSRLVEALRLSPTDGIFHYANLGDVIRSVTSSAVKNIKIDGTEPELRIDLAHINNEKTYRHVMINLGIRVLDVPSYLQNTKYGIYNAGLGNYIQKGNLFVKGKASKETYYVYPLYNHEIADKPGKKLMIFSTPTVTYKNVDHTYMLDGDILKIISHGDIVGGDTSQKNLINAGDSVLSTTVGTVLKQGAVVTDSALKATKNSNLSGSGMYTKKDGSSNANYIGPKDNLYKYQSDVAANALSPYQVVWMFSNPELLFPGMPVIFVYNDAVKGVVRLRGVLHTAFTRYTTGNDAHTTIINVLLESSTDSKPQNSQTVDVTY